MPRILVPRWHLVHDPQGNNLKRCNKDKIKGIRKVMIIILSGAEVGCIVDSIESEVPSLILNAWYLNDGHIVGSLPSSAKPGCTRGTNWLDCNAMMLLTSRYQDSDFVSPDIDGIM